MILCAFPLSLPLSQPLTVMYAGSIEGRTFFACEQPLQKFILDLFIESSACRPPRKAGFVSYISIFDLDSRCFWEWP